LVPTFEALDDEPLSNYIFNLNSCPSDLAAFPAPPVPGLPAPADLLRAFETGTSGFVKGFDEGRK
jgi:hypothetical protein